jgi:hypothetical protein
VVAKGADDPAGLRPGSTCTQAARRWVTTSLAHDGDGAASSVSTVVKAKILDVIRVDVV